MIVPSKKLKEFVDLYSNRADLCRLIDIEESYLSNLMTGKRGASASIIEKFYRGTQWPLSEAWEIVDGKEDE